MRASLANRLSCLSLLAIGCAGPHPSPPLVCADARSDVLAFALRESEPGVRDEFFDANGSEFLYISRDCRFAVRAGPEAVPGGWAPARVGTLTAAETDEINRELLTLSWADYAGSAVGGAGAAAVLVRDEIVVGCAGECDAAGALAVAREWAARLYARGAPSAGDVWMGWLPGDPGYPPLIDLGVSFPWPATPTVMRVSGADAAAVRGARDVAMARPDFDSHSIVPVRVSGMLMGLYVRDALPMEDETGLVRLPGP